MNVYFIKTCDNAQLIKVGKANDVSKRLKELQTACPVDLEVVAVIPCKDEARAFLLEKQIHEQFKNLRVRGEWFTWSKALRKFINSINSGNKRHGQLALADNYKKATKHAYRNGWFNISGVKMRRAQGYDLIARFMSLAKYDGNAFMTITSENGYTEGKVARQVDIIEKALAAGYRVLD